MTPEQFVIELKEDVRSMVDDDIEYFENPPVENPPEHMGMFSRWYRGLSEDDKAMARMAMQYAAEGSLFGLLNVIDNAQCLPSMDGTLELYYVEGDTKTRLNDPDGEFLYDLFNSTD